MGADVIQARYEKLENIAGCFGQWAESNVEMNSRLERGMQARIIHSVSRPILQYQ